MLDARDRALDAALPLVRAPRYGKLPELGVGQVRFVTARSGLYVEGRSEVLRARAPVCPFLPESGLPFGDVSDELVFPGGAPPRALLGEMVALARRRLPNEWAAVVLWRDGRYVIHEPQVLSASPHRIQYLQHGIDPLQVVFDVHSHGAGRAFFSAEDDFDDGRRNPSPVFISMVLGELDDPEFSVAQRLVINNRFFQRVGRRWLPPDVAIALAAAIKGGDHEAAR